MQVHGEAKPAQAALLGLTLDGEQPQPELMLHEASKVWAAPIVLTSSSISASRGMQAPHFLS